MSTLHINHINIRAAPELINTLRDFYCDALDLQVGHRPNFRSQGYWLYAGERALIHLSMCKTGELRSANVKNTLDHIAFDCENQRAMCDKLTRLGIEFSLDQVPNSPISQVFFHDPAGNGVELSFNDRTYAKLSQQGAKPQTVLQHDKAKQRRWGGFA